MASTLYTRHSKIYMQQESSVPSHTHGSPLFATLRRSLAGGAVLLATSSAWALQAVHGGVAGGPTRGGGTGAPLNAPEINPALMTGAIILLAGGVLILTSRRRVARSSKS
jgi:hypothetical protein